MVLKKVIRFHREHGLKALIIKVRLHIISLAKKWFEKNFKKEQLPYEIIYKQFPSRKPIVYIKTDQKIKRLNLIVDDLENHLSPLVLAILFVDRHQIALRIISRTSNSNPHQLINFLDYHQLPKPLKMEFFSDFDKERRLEVSDDDLFLTTSPCTNEAIKHLNPRNHFLFSTKNPVFSFQPQKFQPKTKYKLLFEPDDLFYKGLEILEEAFLQGILDPKVWELHFLSSFLHPLKFSNGLIPKYHKKLSFRLLEECDLILSFNNPYKPYEVASLGKVALTNCTIKNSANIVVEEIPFMLRGLKSAVVRVKNPDPSPQKIEWKDCFKETLTEMEAHVFQK